MIHIWDDWSLVSGRVHDSHKQDLENNEAVLKCEKIKKIFIFNDLDQLYFINWSYLLFWIITIIVAPVSGISQAEWFWRYFIKICAIKPMKNTLQSLIPWTKLFGFRFILMLFSKIIALAVGQKCRKVWTVINY